MSEFLSYDLISGNTTSVFITAAERHVVVNCKYHLEIRAVREVYVCDICLF